MVAESIAILSAKIREMIGAAKQVEAGRDVEEVVRETGVAKHTIRIWQERLRGKGVAEGQERRVIGDEAAPSAALLGFVFLLMVSGPFVDSLLDTLFDLAPWWLLLLLGILLVFSLLGVVSRMLSGRRAEEMRSPGWSWR